MTLAVAATAVPPIARLPEDWGFSTPFIVLTVAAAAILVGAIMLPKRV